MSIQFDDICEVFTDKLVAKIPSTHDGIIKKINFKNDDICLVGHSLVEVESEGSGEAIPQKKETPAAEPHSSHAHKS